MFVSVKTRKTVAVTKLVTTDAVEGLKNQIPGIIAVLETLM